MKNFLNYIEEFINKSHNYIFIDENRYEYEPRWLSKILKYKNIDPYGEKDWENENKIYENQKPKYVNLNDIISDCKGNITLVEKTIGDLLVGEICIWYTKSNIIKDMTVNSVEVNNCYQVYLNGYSVDKEMKVEILNVLKKEDDDYVVGFPSGEVIYLKKDQIEKLKKEKLIKYSRTTGVYGFIFYFNDTDYHKIKLSLNPNYKKSPKSQIIERTLKQTLDLEEHEIDDDYYIKNLFKKNDK